MRVVVVVVVVVLALTRIIKSVVTGQAPVTRVHLGDYGHHNIYWTAVRGVEKRRACCACACACDLGPTWITSLIR